MFLGIDCSTQSLKLQIIDESKVKVKEVVVVYDDELPHYNTKNGIIRFNRNEFEHISTPTLLFVESLELAFNKIKNEYDLSKIKGISGSGQQHGSVWWKKGSLKNLQATDCENLVVNLKSSFSLPLSPIWMDNSTSSECDEITKSVGSAANLAKITGSRAYERFTGPQIRHIYKHQPDVYENTERISLISSFLASLLIGDYAPIDLSDGSGMNILDIRSCDWDKNLLDFIAPNLEQKLGKPISSDQKIGCLSSYWCKKYGFSSDCEIFAFSGDNPCSLVGLGLNKPGDLGISLGTSDVLFGVTAEPKPNPEEGSILIHPLNFQTYMLMLVYKNGSTTRKYIKDFINPNDADWTKFNEILEKTPVGNNGCISFYYLETEITPNIQKSGVIKFNDKDERIDERLNETDFRGIVESQVLSYKHHCQLLGLNKITSILVTGGGSVNKSILQIIADVFEIEVVPSFITNTACSGAAIRALNSYNKAYGKDVFQGSLSVSSKDTIRPIPEHFSIYRKLLARYGRLEHEVTKILNQ